MERIKKSIVIFGAVAIALLMVSSVTAVNQMDGKSVVSIVEEQDGSKSPFSNNGFLESLNLEELNTIDLGGIIDYITQIYDDVIGNYCQIELKNNQELEQLAMQISSMEDFSSEEMVINIMSNDLIMGLVEDISKSTEQSMGNEYNEFANIPFSLFDGVLLEAKQVAIDQLGEDVYNQILDDVSGIVSSYVDPYEGLIFYEILREIAAIICVWTLLLFGHGLIGSLIAVLLILTVITIPLALYSAYLAGVVSLLAVAQAVEESADWDFIVEQWGILGGFIVVVFLALPIALAVILVGWVVLTPLMFCDMMWLIIAYAYDEANP